MRSNGRRNFGLAHNVGAPEAAMRRRSRGQAGHDGNDDGLTQGSAFAGLFFVRCTYTENINHQRK